MTDLSIDRAKQIDIFKQFHILKERLRQKERKYSEKTQEVFILR